ncbi:MAG: hypothetical protein NWF07_11375 [Candidatus Bathyarchaeota archaeon]|nr:hypothetical protein [Candidatus Bathyarchaeota archaeon]
MCELLVEIILDSKNKLSNEVVLSILAMWKDKQAITINKTLILIKTAQDANPDAALVLLTKMGLMPSSGTVELDTLNGR